MLASEPMKEAKRSGAWGGAVVVARPAGRAKRGPAWETRAIVFSVAAFGALAACGGPQGHLMVDTPVIAYQKPDISDITGIDEDDSDAGSASEAGSAAGSAAGSGSGSAAAPSK